MAEAQTIRVRGLTELMQACRLADLETRQYVRSTLREVGEDVRTEATARFSAIDTRSAHGYRTRVRQRGVAVEQSLRKVTGRRGDYGSLQMRRGLLPALGANADTLERKMERALDLVCDHLDARTL